MTTADSAKATAELYAAWGIFGPAFALVVTIVLGALMISSGSARSAGGKASVVFLFLVAAVSAVGLAFAAKTLADYKSLSSSLVNNTTSPCKTLPNGCTKCGTDDCFTIRCPGQLPSTFCQE
jgi:hypothetical protein